MLSISPRALAKNPKLLLCDEPTGALDYATGKQILKLLQDTCKNHGVSVVVITHNLALTAMGDKVIKVRNGLIESIEINESSPPDNCAGKLKERSPKPTALIVSSIFNGFLQICVAKKSIRWARSKSKRSAESALR